MQYARILCIAFFLASLLNTSLSAAQVHFSFASSEKGIRIEGLREEAFKSEIMGDEHRLVIDSKKFKGEAFAVIDAEAVNAENGFSTAELAIIFHGNPKLQKIISIYGSDNCRDFVKWNYVLAEKASTLSNGYKKTTIAYSSKKTWRFVKIAIEGISPKDYWTVQLSEINLATEGSNSIQNSQNQPKTGAGTFSSEFPATAYIVPR